jgi:peptide chain release factor subunit 1
MRQFNFLSGLLDVQPNDSPFISLYLNTEPNETGKKDFDVFLKKQLSDHAAVMEEGSSRRESFEALSQKIRDHADTIDPSTRGAAIFAREGDFFRTFEFEIPFEENRMYMFDRPYVFPLVRLIDQNPTFAIVSADTNSANIYVIKRAEVIRRDEIHNTKTNRTEVGGWSQARYQRHIDNFHQQHAKEVIEELDKIVSGDRIDYVVFAGDEAVIIPLLRDAMSDELNKKIVATIPLNVDTPQHELAEAASEAIAEAVAQSEKEKIEHLFEVNYDDGVGVTGFEKTLAALFNGQVQELYLSSNPEDIAYNSADVKVLVKDYAPCIDDDSFPNIGEHEMMIDELIRQAVSSSVDEINFIDAENVLKRAGGVGAILRYQAKGVSN